MGKDNLKKLILLVLFLLPAMAFSQPNDCRRAIVLCSDKSFSFTPREGAGMDDFLNPKNDPGCLERRENISVWFYFEFRKDMPANAGISFTLQDTSVLNCGQDYDFALYRANGTCDSLGSPVRCSFAQIDPNTRIIRTGMGGGATDTSEDLSGDGFVDSLLVQPGEGFYLLVDFFVGVCTPFDSTTAQSFRFSWGGTAAPYLNCIANPNCDLVSMSAGADSTLCAGTEYLLKGLYAGTNGGATWRWKGLQEADNYLTDRDVTSAMVRIPSDVFGDQVFVATLEEGNCIHTDTVVLHIRPLPFPVVSGDEQLCPGQQGQLMTGSGYARYVWSTGSTSITTLINGPGSYTVTVVNSFGCSGSDSLVVSSRPMPAPFILGDTILCPGEQSVLRTNTGFPGYQWSDGSTTDSLVVRAGGRYSVTLTNQEGCSASAVVSVKMIQPSPPPVWGNPYFCAGGFTTLSTENHFRSLLWSNGSTANSIEVAVPGEVHLMVVDTFGCPSESSLPIRRVENPTPAIMGTLHFCVGDATQLSTDSSYAAYAWSGGATTPAIFARQPGTYVVHVTDSLGCIGSDSVQVAQKDLPVPLIQGTLSFCAGDISRLSVANSYSSFAWSTGEVLPDILVSQKGIFKVTVTDVFGCMGEAEVEVQVNNNPKPILLGPEKLCPDSIAVLRLHETYTSYSWSEGQTSPTILVGIAGTYRVTVTDAHGCMGTTFLQLEEQPRPMLTISGSSRICEGDSATWIATSGFSSYHWSNGGSTHTQLLTQSGLYLLTVTDRYGCGTTAHKALTVLSNPEVQIAGPTAFCSGNQTILEAPLGYASYAWSTGSEDETTVITEGGTYSLTLTTPQGCQRESVISVQAFDPRMPDITPGTHYLCPGDTIHLDAGSGFASYRWSTGSKARMLDVVTEGIIYLDVVDSNGCATNVRWEALAVPIKQPDILGPSTLCTGQPVQLVASGGSYVSYLWSGGEVKPALQVTQGGTYTLTVTDKYGCRASSSRSILEKPSPIIAIDGELSICRNDSTVLTVTGGYADYLWNTEVMDSSILVKAPGKYKVYVTGANGCQVSEEVEVVQSRIPYPVIEGDRFFCKKDSVALEVEAGFPSYTWSTGQTGNRIFVSQEGIYRVTVYDELGCSGFAGIKVFSMEVPEPEIVGARPFCPHDSIALHLKESYAMITWFPSMQTRDTFFAHQAGQVSVEVVASNSCKGRDTILLSQLPAPTPEIIGSPYVCAGGETRLSVRDTFAMIQWSVGEQTPSVLISQPQRVQVETYNSLGCRGIDTLSITEIPLPLLEPLPDTTLDCLRRVVEIGNPAWTTQQLRAHWKGPGLTGSQAEQLHPSVTVEGLYSVVLEDLIYGCLSDTGYVQVADLAYIPNLLAWTTDTLDCVTDSVQIQVASSDTRLNLDWYSDGVYLSSDTSLVAKKTGWYRVVLKDENTGCSNEQDIAVVADFQKPTPLIEGVDTLTCTTSELRLFVALDNRLEYAWFNTEPVEEFQANTSFIHLTSPGWYHVEVRNKQNGCIGLDSVQIVQDTLAPSPNAGLDATLDCHSREALLEITQPNADWKLFWRDAATDFILSRTDSLLVALPGTFVLEAQDKKNGCIGRDTIAVREPENLPDSLVLESLSETCVGYADGKIQVVRVGGGIAPFVYRMSGVEAFSAATEFPRLPPGEYRIIAQDAVGCETSAKILVGTGNDPTLNLGSDQTISLGDFVQLQAVSSVPETAQAYFSWTTPDTLSNKFSRTLTLQPLATTEYRAIIRDERGCEASGIVRVFVEASSRLFLPNAFSPDGDGVNDVFMVFSGPEVVRIRYLRLFDRWGEQVFTRSDFLPNDPSQGWDGSFHGVTMNPAVFVYVGEAEYLDGRVEVFKGDVLLMR